MFYIGKHIATKTELYISKYNCKGLLIKPWFSTSCIDACIYSFKSAREI